MQFQEYKDIIRADIGAWLQESWTASEAPIETYKEMINPVFLDRVAKYLYANEYEIGDMGGLEITLYDYERYQPSDEDIRRIESVKAEPIKDWS